VDLESRVRQIEERNRSVEADKTWETSLARKVLLAGLTYIVISAFLWTMNFPNALLSAIVPVCGFVISTLALNFFKEMWLSRKR